MPTAIKIRFIVRIVATEWIRASSDDRNRVPGGQSLALFLIQIGVPKKPKAFRIWFSRNR
jgi:hypothetical protein